MPGGLEKLHRLLRFLAGAYPLFCSSFSLPLSLPPLFFVTLCFSLFIHYFLPLRCIFPLFFSLHRLLCAVAALLPSSPPLPSDIHLYLFLHRLSLCWCVTLAISLALLMQLMLDQHDWVSSPYGSCGSDSSQQREVF